MTDLQHIALERPPVSEDGCFLLFFRIAGEHHGKIAIREPADDGIVIEVRISLLVLDDLDRPEHLVGDAIEEGKCIARFALMAFR